MDEQKLQNYLQKCELQYRADHAPSGSTVKWLVPYCRNTHDIAAFLRGIGFRIKEVMDEEPYPGETYRWVITTSGVIVYVSDDGLVAKEKGYIYKL